MNRLSDGGRTWRVMTRFLESARPQLIARPRSVTGVAPFTCAKTRASNIHFLNAAMIWKNHFRASKTGMSPALLAEMRPILSQHCLQGTSPEEIGPSSGLHEGFGQVFGILFPEKSTTAVNMDLIKEDYFEGYQKAGVLYCLQSEDIPLFRRSLASGDVSWIAASLPAAEQQEIRAYYLKYKDCNVTPLQEVYKPELYPFGISDTPLESALKDWAKNK